MSVTLPTTIKVPEQDMFKYTYFFAGDKKVGKTSFATQFPDHFMLEMEVGNAKHLQANYVDVYDFLQCWDYVQLLKANPNYCKTLIIDDVVTLYGYVVRHVRQHYKMGNFEPMRIDHWGIVRNIFQGLIDEIKSLNVCKIFTNHTETHTLTDINKTEYSRIETSMSPQCNSMMDAIANLWGTIMYDENGNRLMYLEGTKYLKAGNGFDDHFLNPLTGGKLPFIEMGSSAKEAYDNFCLAYYNSYKHRLQHNKTNDVSITGERVPLPIQLKEKPLVGK